MKYIFAGTIGALSMGFASVASAAIESYQPAPSVDTGGDATGAIVLLLLVGAVVLMNGGMTSRNTQQLDTDQNANDDTIMKF